jgi:hypothetical protein
VAKSYKNTYYRRLRFKYTVVSLSNSVFSVLKSPHPDHFDVFLGRGTKLPYYSMNLYLCGIMVVMVGANGIFPNVYCVQKPVNLLDLSASKHDI